MTPTPHLAALSAVAGWIADRRIPRFLRRPIYGLCARVFAVNTEEARLGLADYPSLGAFFVRELKPGARPIDPAASTWVSPVDGCVQAAHGIEGQSTLQAKGMSYALDTLLGSESSARALEDGTALTLYLSPRDYHRIHAPRNARLEEVSWIAGSRYSVAPKVLLRRMVFPENERVVLRFSSRAGPFWMVLVGALNVSRIRVVGIEPGEAVTEGGREFAKGEELGRFELGSTVILLWPAGGVRLDDLPPETVVRLGTPIAH